MPRGCQRGRKKLPLEKIAAGEIIGGCLHVSWTGNQKFNRKMPFTTKNKTITGWLWQSSHHNRNKGHSVVELLVAGICSGVILLLGVNIFVNVLRITENLEAKTNQSNTLARALSFIQEEIKQADYVMAVTGNEDKKCDSPSIDSQHCLKIITSNIDNNPNREEFIYYAFDDISVGQHTWQKPGVLRRKTIKKDGTDSGWRVIVDGLISVREKQPTVTCNQDGIRWDMNRWNTSVYGGTKDDKGGFRFCVNNKGESQLVRIFLYGHIMRTKERVYVSGIALTRGIGGG